MNQALIIQIFFGGFIVFWVGGFLIYGYHIFSYGVPGDATKKSFIILTITSALLFVFITFNLAGIDWGALR
jgi:hypothetical protein